ncbi:MAG: hypothetical protein ACE363_05945 [Alphaproteobacteria bacterium]
MTERVSEGWHLDKRVSVGHIVTTMMAVVAAGAAYANLSERVAVLEVQDSAILQDLREIRRTVERIEDKLDRKVDK